MPLFDVRSMVALTLALLTAAVSGGLTLAAGANWPTAVLAAGGAGWGVLTGVSVLMR
ncbi:MULTISPECIES: hypothetical protein [unclassified Streptomyces]|uniref:hypothetical protein n=1 Tax=unclassified Streptomyces TaxID=2593676 RepID=UPI002DD956B9|nr:MULTISPECIES: hypothetical protein [unclassified Streptomyces]WSF82586.1 hypothetical protein OIE70_05380 [Streptomyces sp. NBC_01744]WSC41157.1 hypothetical protein OHA08_39935 [Streptomyces sp. NBC_01763]WSC49257.1 hypothetical protein OIE61_37990 [Streptomyces sp. NBC_01762]WSC51738.1 hypothetical protein OG808_05255 [Streptomyces sp. NBC_01761]WSD28920.1 hypothetical protein OHA26_38755 [Streptomyces sp. NBC_01751]